MVNFIVLMKFFKNVIYIFMKGFFFLVNLIEWEEMEAIKSKGFSSFRLSIWKKVGYGMFWGWS